MSKYIIQDKTIIFNPEYNELFDTEILEILLNSNTIIFNDIKNGKCVKSTFNKPIDNLPSSLTNLTFGFSFNKPVNNLPNSIQNLIFGEKFNLSVDLLPNSIINLTFGTYFNQFITKIPFELKTIKISKKMNNNFKILLSKLIFGVNPNVQMIEY